MNTNLNRRKALRLLSLPVIGGTALTSPAPGNAHPARPIQNIVPRGGGGGRGGPVREMAPVLSQRLGQPVVVDNRPGAIGTIGSLLGARSPADGYTLIYGAA